MHDYEAKAIGLAGDRAAVAAIRDSLSRNRTRTPLFDTGLFVRHFEAALTEMHARQSNGIAPRSFAASGQLV
jgi:protein O-GlcNAc transferase